MRESSLTSYTFSDGNQDPPLLADDGLSSPIQLPFKYSARYPSEVSPIIPASNTSYRSPSENNLDHRDARSPPTDTDQGNPPGLGSPDTFHEKGFGVDPIRKNTNVTDYTKADGLSHNEDSAEVGLEGNVETEIDGLLEELMDYHLKWTTETSELLLPLPEEFSPTDGPLSSQPYADHSLPPLVTIDMSYSGNPDTLSLTPSSPRSSKDSYLSSTSPSLKSKRSFALITPSTDGWRSPPTAAAVTERKASTSDYSDYTKIPAPPGVWSPDPRQVLEGVTRDGYPRVSSKNRRARHTNLPPLTMTIPEDSIIQRRAKNPTPSEHRRVNTSIDHSAVSSYFSDDDASEITEVGYMYSGFDPAHLSASSAVSPQFNRSRPWDDASRGSGASFHSRYSPSPSVTPSSIDYPPPSNNRYTLSPKRGVLQSLFSPNGTSERKKERKRAKAQDPIQTQYLDTRSVDAVSFSTTSSKSSKKAEKTAKRVQLAAQLSAKQLPRAGDKGHGGAPQKGSATWEESGAMYSMDGIF